MLRPFDESDDPRIVAIRANEIVGRGTCTAIDECYSDQELLDRLNEDDIETPEQAVRWAIEDEGLWLEKGTNQRWGEDDDPQITRYDEFNKQVREYYED